jgi:hypothetical protein
MLISFWMFQRQNSHNDLENKLMILKWKINMRIIFIILEKKSYFHQMLLEELLTFSTKRGESLLFKTFKKI